MKTKFASSLFAALAFRRPRFLSALVLPLAAAILPVAPALAQTITSAVPGYISYQGKVTNAAGTAVGAGTPVNRTVIFRLWSHSSNSTVNDLVYAEQQTVTISEGEFSVLIGQGTAVSGTPLGYSESSKGPPTVTFNNSFTVFGGATRYLGVTVDDGTASADPEVSPRQQLVTNAYAFRARFAEGLGSNGNFSVAVTDQGNFGVGIANPTFPVTTAATLGDKIGLFGNFNYGIGIQASTVQLHGAGATDDIAFGYGSSAAMTETVRFKGNGNVGIGTANPTAKLDVNGAINVSDGGTKSLAGGIVSEAGSGMINFGMNDTRFGTPQNNTSQGGFLRVNTQGVSNLFQFYARPATSAALSEVMSITSAGNVGIGTASPTSKLHVNGTLTATDISTTGNFSLGTTTSEAKLNVFSSTANTSTNTVLFRANGINSGNNTSHIHYGTNGDIYWRSAANAGVVVLQDTGGNVGVGTSAPATTLDVRGSAPFITVGTTSASRGGLYLGNNGHGLVRGFPSGGDNNNVGLYTTAGDVYLSASGSGTSNHLVVKSDGKVGIGTSSPSVPLHVAGVTALSFNIEAWGTTGGFGDVGNVFTNNVGLGIISDSGVRASLFYVNSDARIKQVQGRSSGAVDLATLQKIEVVDYTYRDKMVYGGAVHKKVIAQQVEQIFPQAVNRGQGLVPDIFQKATFAGGWVALATDLKVGEHVRLIGDGADAMHEVLEVQPGRFRTAFKPAGDKVFVYGREVKDFRSVDYEAIAMLNVSATQEIKREKDAELTALRAQNDALARRVAELEAKDRARDAKLASIEKLLQSSQTVMASPAKPTTGNGQE